MNDKFTFIDSLKFKERWYFYQYNSHANLDTSSRNLNTINKRDISTKGGTGNIIIGPSRWETIGTAIATNAALTAAQAASESMRRSDNPYLQAMGQAINALLAAEGEEDVSDAGDTYLPPPPQLTDGGQVIPGEFTEVTKKTPAGRFEAGPRDAVTAAAAIGATFIARTVVNFVCGKKQFSNTQETQTSQSGGLEAQNQGNQGAQGPFSLDRTVRVEHLNRAPEGELIDLNSNRGNFQGGPSAQPSAPPLPNDPAGNPNNLFWSGGQANQPALVNTGAQTDSVSSLMVTCTNPGGDTIEGIRYTTLNINKEGLTEGPITIYPPASAGIEVPGANGSDVTIKIEPADGFNSLIDSLPGSNYAWRVAFSLATNILITPLIYKGGHFLFRKLGSGIQRVLFYKDSQEKGSLISNDALETIPSESVLPDEVIPPDPSNSPIISKIEELGDEIASGEYSSEQLKGLLGKVSLCLTEQDNIIIWTLPATWVMNGKKILLIVLYGCGAILVVLATVGIIYYSIKFYKRLDQCSENSPKNKDRKGKEGPENRNGPFYNGKKY